MKFEDEFVVTGDLDGLDEFDGLPEEETDSEDRFFAAELVPEFTASPFVVLHPAAVISKADKQSARILRIFMKYLQKYLL